MNISCLDIETAPNLVWTYELHKAYISPSQIVLPTHILGFAAKWLDDGSGIEQATHWYSELDGYKNMLDDLFEWLSLSDAVIHYNGNRFDRKKINWEFVKYDIGIPSPAKNIDLWRTIVTHFDPVSSKLEFVAPELVGAEKDKSGGMKTFIGCMNKDPQAWKDLAKYCKQDVDLLPMLYRKLQPWITNHPNQANFSGLFSCPACGSEDLQKRGFQHTQQRRYQRYRCNDCGHWSQGSKSLQGAEIKSVVL